MPELILIRHAKSDWSTPARSDHARPLNDRGRRSARAIGAWLAAREYVPSEVLCSDAARTAETWALLSEALPQGADIRFLAALYHASAPEMLAVLKGATAERVAMIGHNPGIADFAGRLVATAPDHPRFHDYPTGATTVIAFDAPSWDAVGWGQGQVRDFIVPRELTA